MHLIWRQNKIQDYLAVTIPFLLAEHSSKNLRVTSPGGELGRLEPKHNCRLAFDGLKSLMGRWNRGFRKQTEIYHSQERAKCGKQKINDQRCDLCYKPNPEQTAAWEAIAWEASLAQYIVLYLQLNTLLLAAWDCLDRLFGQVKS